MKMSKKRSNCWITVSINSRKSIKELKQEMRDSADYDLGFSCQSSQSSSESSVKCLENIYDYCMRSEIVGPFERVEDFMKKINTEDLKLCDIIEYRCKDASGVPFSHWALYVGDGNIIHFNGGDGGIVLMARIDYSPEDNPCRVNNMSRYAKSKNYTERSYSQVMSAALKDLDICHIPYHITANNCGHMVTLWKYGKGFNPEVATHLQITVPVVGGIAMGLAGSIVGGVIGYAIESIPNFCICALIGGTVGAVVGITIFAGVGLCIGAFLGYKYTATTRKQLYKIYINGRKSLKSNPALKALPNADNAIPGILITDADNCENVVINQSNVASDECNGNNCEIVLYPQEDVVHMVVEDHKIIINRHNINERHNCCHGIDHKQVRVEAYDPLNFQNSK